MSRLHTVIETISNAANGRFAAIKDAHTAIESLAAILRENRVTVSAEVCWNSKVVNEGELLIQQNLVWEKRKGAWQFWIVHEEAPFKGETGALVSQLYTPWSAASLEIQGESFAFFGDLLEELARELLAKAERIQSQFRGAKRMADVFRTAFYDDSTPENA